MLFFCLTREAYFAIQGSLDSNFALTCPTTNCESLRINRLLAPTTRASPTPAIMTSYSDSLLEASKPKRTACSILSQLGRLIVDRCRLLIVWKPHRLKRVHRLFSSGQVSGCGISARKSAKTCPLFESLGLYWIPYSLSSTAQWAILPDISGL